VPEGEVVRVREASPPQVTSGIYPRKHKYEREDPILGVVRLCGRCEEEWPLDSEFWYFKRGGSVMGPCRACWSERNKSQPFRAHP
jgi:hypothetical protein